MPQQETIDQAITSAAVYRQRRDQGKPWRAPSGAIVRVRSLDITDHAVLARFPDYLRAVIYQVIERSPSLKPAEDDDVTDALFAGLSGEELLNREAEIGQTLCKLGWIEPAVVDEVTDPDIQISVAELDAQDRRGYMEWVFGAYAQEAQPLATFPAGSAGRVGPVSTVQAESQGSQRAAPAGDVRVLARDSV